MRNYLFGLTSLAVLLSIISFTFKQTSQSNKIENNFKKIVYKSKAEILASHEWKVEEVKSNVEGKNLQYLENGENDTEKDYSIFRLTFAQSGTGTYTDLNGNVYNMKWQFTSENEHNMRMVLENGISYDWSMVEISEVSFQSISELFINGHDLIQSTRFVPVHKDCLNSDQ